MCSSKASYTLFANNDEIRVKWWKHDVQRIVYSKCSPCITNRFFAICFCRICVEVRSLWQTQRSFSSKKKKFPVANMFVRKLTAKSERCIAGYTLFVTVTILLFREKNSVLQNVMKRGLHTIRHRPQFSRMCVATENTAKKVLWISQKTAYSCKRISQKNFSRNAHKSDKSLSTYYLCSALISSVRSFFVIVRK